MLDKHEHSIPLILQSNSIRIDKSKYLVPDTMAIPQFMLFVRKKLDITNPAEALFLFAEKIDEDKEDQLGATILAPQNKTVAELYAMCKHTDNFLYVYIEKENTFGVC